MSTHEEHGRVLASLRSEGESWASRRDAEIRAAHKDGMSFRTIGSYVGMSHSGVEKVVKSNRVQDR